MPKGTESHCLTSTEVRGLDVDGDEKKDVVYVDDEPFISIRFLLKIFGSISAAAVTALAFLM